MIGGFLKIVFSIARFSMNLQFSITISLSLFTAGWYVVTKGNIPSAVLCFCDLRANCLESKVTWHWTFYIFPWIPACFEALFKVCKALFKCCFWRVCSKQSNCFAFDKASFTPEGGTRLNGYIERFLSACSEFWCLGWIPLWISLLWTPLYQGKLFRSLIFRPWILLLGEMCWPLRWNAELHLYYSPKGRKRHQCNVSILLAWYCFVELNLSLSLPWIYLQKTGGRCAWSLELIELACMVKVTINKAKNVQNFKRKTTRVWYFPLKFLTLLAL